LFVVENFIFLFNNLCIMIITISGNAGSGKSTVASMLVDKLSAKRIYVGGIRREMARKMRMDLAEFNKYGETHPETDIDVDNKIRDEARLLDGVGEIVIVEGRTQYYFLPESFKVFIKVDPMVGAQRIFLDLKENKDKRNEDNVSTLEQVEKSIEKRQKSDAKRYKKYYSIDPYNEKNYDLVIDSSKVTPEQVCEKIIESLRSERLLK